MKNSSNFAIKPVKSTLLGMAALLAIGWGATAAPAAQAKGHAHSASLQRLAAARIARHKVGRRYVYGAVGPATFDCSGLVIFAYHKAGIPLGKVRTTFQMWSRGHHIARTRLLPGDVVFVYSASHGHVGVYLGGGKFVHAPAPGRRVSIGILPRQGAGYYGATRL